jgi:DNA-binding GntR family transcriptional regulator
VVPREKAVENIRSGMVDPRRKHESKKTSLANEVYSILLQMLISKELPPGTLLNRRSLATQLGVSVAPVLEAVIQLELEGYLVTIPRKGTIVAPFGLKEIYEHLIVREALECQAARLYCGKAVRDNYERLLVKAATLDSTFVDGQGNWNLEYDFHESLVALSDSSLLIHEFSRLIRLGTFYSMYYIYSSPGTEKVLNSHHQLLSLLSKEDPDGAEKAIREHLRTTKSMLLDEFKKNGLTVPEMLKEHILVASPL